MLYVQHIYALFTVVSLLFFVPTNASSGLRITVNEKALDMVNQAEISAFQTDLKGKHFPDIRDRAGDLLWSVTNIHVHHVGSMTPSINLLSTGHITWTCYISSITVNAKWDAKLNIWIPLQVSGYVSASVSRTSLTISMSLSEISGSLGISLSKCSADVGNINLHFTGNLLDGLLNILSGLLKNDLKRELQIAVCHFVSLGLRDITADMKNIITSFPIEIIGIPLTLDNAFTQVKVTSDTISTYHKGAVNWYGHTFYSSDASLFPSARTSRGLAFDLKEDVFNNLLRTYVERGNLDGIIDYSRVLKEGLHVLYLTCKDDWSGLCFGSIVREAAAEFPLRFLGIRWSVGSANLTILDGQITGRITGRIYCSADSASESLLLFSASVELVIAFQLKLSAGIISARALAWGGQVIIDSSSIGKILTPTIEAAANMILPKLRDGVLDIINKYETNYRIELPKNVFIKESSLSLFKGVIRIEADLCYKVTSCATIPNDIWVGNTDVPELVVDDVITTTTSTTTTSTKTTVTTTLKAATTTPTTTTTTTASTTTTTSVATTTPTMATATITTSTAAPTTTTSSAGNTTTTTAATTITPSAATTTTTTTAPATNSSASTATTTTADPTTITTSVATSTPTVATATTTTTTAASFTITTSAATTTASTAATSITSSSANTAASSTTPTVAIATTTTTLNAQATTTTASSATTITAAPTTTTTSPAITTATMDATTITTAVTTNDATSSTTTTPTPSTVSANTKIDKLVHSGQMSTMKWLEKFAGIQKKRKKINKQERPKNATPNEIEQKKKHGKKSQKNKDKASRRARKRKQRRDKKNKREKNRKRSRDKKGFKNKQQRANSKGHRNRKQRLRNKEFRNKSSNTTDKANRRAENKKRGQGRNENVSEQVNST